MQVEIKSSDEELHALLDIEDKARTKSTHVKVPREPLRKILHDYNVMRENLRQRRMLKEPI